MKKGAIAAVLLIAVFTLVLSACGDGDAGLTRAEVEEIVRSEMASEPAQTDPAPGVSSDQVEGIVNDAIEKMAQPEPGLTRAEVEEIVRAAIASIPSKSSPAEYTQHFVENAIARYDAQGLDATLAHYNSPQSVDGQWYVFIIDPERPGHRPPRPRTPGPGHEGLGGHRRQRVRIRA